MFLNFQELEQIDQTVNMSNYSEYSFSNYTFQTFADFSTRGNKNAICFFPSLRIPYCSLIFSNLCCAPYQYLISK